MCGRYLLNTPREAIARWFDGDIPPVLEARYNIAPSQEVPVVRASASGQGREFAMVRWGLIPSWAKEISFGAHTINARAETIAEKPTYRAAFRRRRCLVPADGFYEWKKVGKEKQPHAIRPADGNPIAFAGLWERWQPAGGEAIESMTIITTQANELLRPLHERMPVILPRERYSIWLDPHLDNPADLLPLLTSYPDEKLTLYRVSSWVSNARHEGEKCLTPVEGLFA
jgi:putative SOS response-associated peptidase YedK